LCRLGALQISVIKPLLKANGVNLVAVGLEQLGAEEFIERKFFDGGKDMYSYVLTLWSVTLTEIFIDEKKQCYKDLGYKK